MIVKSRLDPTPLGGQLSAHRLDEIYATIEERLEHLRFQWNGLATAQQTAFFHIEREGAELVQLLRLLAHNRD